MRVAKSNIIIFLQEMKAELNSDGIVTLGLFGSFARDEAGVYSDIDIAIQKRKITLPIELHMTILMKLQK